MTVVTQPTLFLSHGPLSEADRTLLQHVADMGYEMGFDVYLDEDHARANAGNEYRPAMEEALSRCAAAVLFITPASLASVWVQYEAATLVRRSYDDSRLLILPVFADGATPAALTADARWRPVDLAAWQGYSADDGEFPVKLRATLTSLLASTLPTPHGAVVEALSRRLAAASQQSLDEALRHLGITVSGPRWRKAEGLARALFEVVDPRVVGLVATALAAEHPEIAMCVLNTSLPFACLSEDHAAWLRSVVGARRAAATGHKSSRTCTMLIRRACREEPAEWSSISAGGLVADDQGYRLLEDVRHGLRRVFADEEADDDDLRRWLRQQPVLVILPATAVDMEVLRPVLLALPEVTLFFRSTSDDELERQGLGFVSSVQPPLRPETVETALSVYATVAARTRGSV